ncbi:unnamed protein product [Euphydryas editha]|uniref:HTH psq-type domain-containing protein n=1 Tax=Euphydryas editha TaxID=104508 RepID=A0AAU9UXL5_EUPED|nr:unnamed protein product [Euphydryas editha]
MPRYLSKELRAARHYNVPRRTLRHYLQQNKEPVSTLGRKPILNISRRTAQNLNPIRAQKLNIAVVADYFAKLKKAFEDNDIMNKPERIFNIDEKSYRGELDITEPLRTWTYNSEKV